MSRKKKRPGLGRRGKNKKGEREERGMGRARAGKGAGFVFGTSRGTARAGRQLKREPLEIVHSDVGYEFRGGGNLEGRSWRCRYPWRNGLQRPGPGSCRYSLHSPTREAVLRCPPPTGLNQGAALGGWGAWQPGSLGYRG